MNQNEYTPLTTIPGAFTANQPVSNPVDVVKNIYGISIGIAAILAVCMIIWAGVQYTTSEAIGQKTDAKSKWQHAIIGLLILLSAYIILRTINVSLVNIDLSNLTQGCGQNGVPCGKAVSQDALTSVTAAASEQAKAVSAAETGSNKLIGQYGLAEQNLAYIDDQITKETLRMSGRSATPAVQADAKANIDALKVTRADAQKKKDDLIKTMTADVEALIKQRGQIMTDMDALSKQISDANLRMSGRSGSSVTPEQRAALTAQINTWTVQKGALDALSTRLLKTLSEEQQLLPIEAPSGIDVYN
ncbi:MAG TPA: pilin [Candidatus Paceibacterota bacterium]|nr:pilin [Candidatus Paceibacterota bacterium]